MKKFVVVMLFTKDYKKLLLVKRKKKPYEGMYNGIGGKLIDGETPIECAIRESFEETKIKLNNPKLLVTYTYPETNPINPGTVLNVIYDFVDEVEVEENYEGTYEWKDVSFVMDAFDENIAGLSNLNQFVKEIFEVENIKKFNMWNK